jgi:hypothetical protein
LFTSKEAYEIQLAVEIAFVGEVVSKESDLP